MKNYRVYGFYFCCLFSVALVMTACGGTTVTETQDGEAYNGKPVSNILVIAVTGNEHNRRSFENTFVRQLKSVGVEAFASEKTMPMPPDLMLKKETILSAVAKHENDAVIITQLISGETKDVDTRGGRSRIGFFYYTRAPTYSSTSTTVRLETNLYDVNTGELIWSVISDTWSKDTTEKIISKVIRAVINNLKKNKLIASD